VGNIQPRSSWPCLQLRCVHIQVAGARYHRAKIDEVSCAVSTNCSGMERTQRDLTTAERFRLNRVDRFE